MDNKKKKTVPTLMQSAATVDFNPLCLANDFAKPHLYSPPPALTTLDNNNDNDTDNDNDNDEKYDKYPIIPMSPPPMSPSMASVTPSVTASISAITPTDQYLCTVSVSLPKPSQANALTNASLNKRGYKKIRSICTTLQGEILECIKIDTKEKIAIKKVSKQLYEDGVSLSDDGMLVIVEENIIKESQILNYLTKQNAPIADYICEYREFFADNYYYYLCMEHCGNKTLLEFVQKSHLLIKRKQLKLKQYQKIVKYLFWQIASMVYWMHNQMNVCHLHLTMENIMVTHGNFIKKQTQSSNSKSNDPNNNIEYTIDPLISIKIIDFGVSEVFKHNFDCWKGNSLTEFHQYCAPQMYDDIKYDARKADTWSLGCILYHMSIGFPIYQYQDETIDPAYGCVVNGNIHKYLKSSKLLCYINKKLLYVITKLLIINESDRLNASQLITVPWLKPYFTKYQQRLVTKPKKKSKNNVSGLPYYSINFNI